ncbi:YoaK family protein [Bradyrhizobium sp. dw_78]|uniref:YoaK family protein n=1 Tax=Bradyrhizobium sp. dw_78 TaxID=2719793 RepID=UPI001BD4ED27|nr:YoaK family protein [Bradyrhizobium sp. dw_78]
MTDTLRPALPGQKTSVPETTRVAVRRVASLGSVAGYIDALGFIDLSGIYTAAMTGNTVQLGVTFARQEWPHFVLVAITLGSFFCGGLLSSFIRRHLPRPALELLIMAGLILAAQIIRLSVENPVSIELPLLAVSMAMQGQTISRFGGMSIQTIVVTNNMLKCADALVGRYLPRRQETPTPVADFILPGCAWLTYVVGAAAAAFASAHFSLPFLIPIVILLLTTVDLVLSSTKEA